MIPTSRRAQSLIEYSVIAVMVIMAIVYGGPFLVNSINARFRIMENNNHDAYYGDLRQANAESGDVSCACNPTNKLWKYDPPNSTNKVFLGGWIRDFCGANGCGPLERSYRRSCSPSGCDTEYDCFRDTSCCGEPVPQECGTIIPKLNKPATVAVDDCMTRRTVSDSLKERLMGRVYDGLCLNALGNATGCLFDERKYAAPCGNATTAEIVCVKEASCEPACVNQTNALANNLVQNCSGPETTKDVFDEVYLRKENVNSAPPPPAGYQPWPYALPGQAAGYTMPFLYYDNDYLVSAGVRCPGDRACQRFCDSPAFVTQEGKSCDLCRPPFTFNGHSYGTEFPYYGANPRYWGSWDFGAACQYPGFPYYDEDHSLPKYLKTASPLPGQTTPALQSDPIDPCYPYCVECNVDSDCNGGGARMAYCQAGRCQKCDPVLGVPEEEERREAASQVEIHFSLFCGETKAVHDLCPLGEKLAPVNGQPKYTYGDWAKGWHQYKTDYCSNTVQYVHGVICGRKTVLPTTEYLCPNDPCFLKVQVNFEGPGNDNDESAKMQCSTGKWNIDAHKCVPDQYQEVFITSAFNEENGGTSQTCPPTNVWSGPGYQTFVGGKFEPYWPTWGGASLDGFSGNYLSLATCTGAHCCIGEPMVLGDLDCEDNNWGNGW